MKSPAAWPSPLTNPRSFSNDAGDCALDDRVWREARDLSGPVPVAVVEGLVLSHRGRRTPAPLGLVKTTLIRADRTMEGATMALPEFGGEPMFRRARHGDRRA